MSFEETSDKDELISAGTLSTDAETYLALRKRSSTGYLKNFMEKLNFVLSSKVGRKNVFREASIQHAEEGFRFLAAILDWEDILDDKEKSKVAADIVSQYVMPGSLYENGCLSSLTREELLSEETVGFDRFVPARFEVANDVWMNLYLKLFIETQYSNLIENQKRRGFFQGVLHVANFRTSFKE
jgi:hypothetical protein